MDEKEFNKVVSGFESHEGRGIVYWRAKEIIQKNPEYTADAVLLLLSTWNFAHMSSVLKKVHGWNFDYGKIKSDVDKVLPYLKDLEGLDIRTVDLKGIEKKISKIYSPLNKNDNIRSVGATKIMMLLNDDLFVAWDNAIKKWKGIYRTEPKDYMDFLRLTQEEFKGIELYEKNQQVSGMKRGFAKAIDEYNFQKAPR